MKVRWTKHTDTCLSFIWCIAQLASVNPSINYFNWYVKFNVKKRRVFDRQTDYKNAWIELLNHKFCDFSQKFSRATDTMYTYDRIVENQFTHVLRFSTLYVCNRILQGIQRRNLKIKIYKWNSLKNEVHYMPLKFNKIYAIIGKMHFLYTG